MKECAGDARIDLVTVDTRRPSYLVRFSFVCNMKINEELNVYLCSHFTVIISQFLLIFVPMTDILYALKYCEFVFISLQRASVIYKGSELPITRLLHDIR